MNAKELFLMLEAVGDPDQLEHIKIVTKDGRSITGVWTELEQNRIVMVQPDRDEKEPPPVPVEADAQMIIKDIPTT